MPFQAIFRKAPIEAVVHKAAARTPACNSFVTASTFPQIFFSKSLMEKLYFRLIKVSPSRARARNGALFAGLDKASCTDLSTVFVDKRKSVLLLRS